MTTQSQQTKEKLISEAEQFISNLGLMVNSVDRRLIAPTKAITVIDEFVARIKGADDPESFAHFERICLRAREAVEVYRLMLN